MNGLPDWDQMSVREQCEVLKARLDTQRMEAEYSDQMWNSVVDRVYAIEAAQGRTFETASETIARMEAEGQRLRREFGQVSDLSRGESHRTHYEGDGCAGGHRLTSKTVEQIPTIELERLLRIEEAARVAVNQFRCGTAVLTVVFESLRSAVEDEP